MICQKIEHKEYLGINKKMNKQINISLNKDFKELCLIPLKWKHTKKKIKMILNQ